MFYKPLITGEKPLNLFIHIGQELPAYAYILDENKQVIFLFAHLENGINWVYNALFYEEKPISASKGKQLMSYERNAPQNYFYWWESEIPEGMSRQEWDKLKLVAMHTLRNFREHFSLPTPYITAQPWEKEAVQQVSSWDDYLSSEFLQNIELEKKLKKRLVKLLKK